MNDFQKIDLAWKTVLKFSGIISINCFFCLMLMLIVGIKLWTIGIVFLISLAGCIVIQQPHQPIEKHGQGHGQQGVGKRVAAGHNN